MPTRVPITRSIFGNKLEGNSRHAVVPSPPRWAFRPSTTPWHPVPLEAILAERNTIVRSMYNLGLAAWLGGSLIGTVGLNGATAEAKTR